jgi:hypothetical protein
VGAVAAFLFYITVSPNAPHALGVSLGEGSIVILAIVVASLFSNAFWASGFCLVFLVVSDPETIAHTTATIVSEHALGVLAGSALAALAFHLVPSRGLVHGWRKQRLKQVAETIGTLIASPVAQQTTSTDHAWQSRSIEVWCDSPCRTHPASRWPFRTKLAARCCPGRTLGIIYSK